MSKIQSDRQRVTDQSCQHRELTDLKLNQLYMERSFWINHYDCMSCCSCDGGRNQVHVFNFYTVWRYLYLNISYFSIKVQKGDITPLTRHICLTALVTS